MLTEISLSSRRKKKAARDYQVVISTTEGILRTLRTCTAAVTTSNLDTTAAISRWICLTKSTTFREFLQTKWKRTKIGEKEIIQLTCRLTKTKIASKKRRSWAIAKHTTINNSIVVRPISFSKTRTPPPKLSFKETQAWKIRFLVPLTILARDPNTFCRLVKQTVSSWLHSHRWARVSPPVPHLDLQARPEQLHLQTISTH